METQTFQAMVVREVGGGHFAREIEDRQVEDLPEGDVLIRVRYSSLNYKDALSASGNKGVTKQYPHTPGIDAAGEVVESTDAAFSEGDAVIVTGFDLGANTDGGFGQYIRVPAGWVVRLPGGLSLQEGMVYGTAGFTAALSVHKLKAVGVTPDRGEVVVTGATGGVGSLAVGLLAKLGYEVIAATGKVHEAAFLEGLGAKAVIAREEVDDESGSPVGAGRWAGAVDTVGGNILATVLKTTQHGGAVTCCGMVASASLNTTVFPFILRGVSLMGVDSVACPMDLRVEMWEKLAEEWRPEGLSDVATVCDLEGLGGQIDRILEGEMRGRVVVDLG